LGFLVYFIILVQEGTIPFHLWGIRDYYQGCAKKYSKISWGEQRNFPDWKWLHFMFLPGQGEPYLIKRK
jgi:hypothetical protein